MVTERIPKLCRAARPNKIIAIERNQVRLLVKMPTIRYTIHATDTLNAGLMKSDVSRFKLWNPDRPSTERSRKEVGARSLREWTIHFSEVVDSVS